MNYSVSDSGALIAKERAIALGDFLVQNQMVFDKEVSFNEQKKC